MPSSRPLASIVPEIPPRSRLDFTRTFLGMGDERLKSLGLPDPNNTLCKSLLYTSSNHSVDHISGFRRREVLLHAK